MLALSPHPNLESPIVWSPASEQSTAPDPSATATDSDVQKQLQVVISQAKEARDVVAFLDQHMSKVDHKTADQMFLALEDFYQVHVPAVNDNFHKLLEQPETAQKLLELEYPFDFNKIKGDDNLKQWLLNQTAGKLKLEATFDMELFWQVDYEALQAYAPFLSDELKAYLSIQTLEMKSAFRGDGGLQISRTELGMRLVNAEQFLTQYPASKKAPQIKTLYTEYLRTYLSDYRYEAIDERTMKLLPTVKTDYQEFVKAHPDTKTAQIVTAYLDVLKVNQDVIYNFGDEGVSIIGDAKPNISRFWDELGGKVDRSFEAVK